MSHPPVNPEKTLAGIAVDPITLERVIPESQRPDGSVRKQLKIRPGFTPQEDVRRFRGTKQAQMDANVLPKGHIIGWTPFGATNPGTGNSSTAAPSNSTPMTKAAKKNAKRKGKREKERAEKVKEEVPDNWEDDDEQVEEKQTTEKEASVQQSAEDILSSQLEKLDVK